MTVRGKRYHEKAGPTEAKARDYRDKLRAWVRDSERGLPARRPEGPRVTFAAFADDYLKLHARHKRSYERDAYSVRHLKAYFNGTALGAIDAEAADRYRASRDAAKRSIRTVNLELACLRSILYYAVRLKRLATYPLPTKGLLKREPEFKPRVLEVEEAQRLIAVASPAFLRDALIIFLGTGLRLRELLKLRRSDVDFRRAELTVTAERAKNGKARTVPLGAEALEALGRRPGREYFFENPQTGRPVDSLDAAWATAKTKAGIKGRLRIHDLRDTFATWRLRAGVDLRTLAELIGDSPEVTLRRYCHTDERTKRAAVETLPALVAGSPQILQTEPMAAPATAPESIN